MFFFSSLFKKTRFCFFVSRKQGFVCLFQEQQGLSLFFWRTAQRAAAQKEQVLFNQEPGTRCCFLQPEEEPEEEPGVCVFQKRRTGVLLLCSRKPGVCVFQKRRTGVLLFKKTRRRTTLLVVPLCRCAVEEAVVEQKNTWSSSCSWNKPFLKQINKT